MRTSHNLTIDTDISIRSSINSISTQIYPQKNQEIFNSVSSETENIVKANKKICTAVKKRIQEQKEARNEMEIMELRWEISELKKSIEKIQICLGNNGAISENQPGNGPSVCKNHVFRLKERLKEAKRMNKKLRNEASYENSKLRSKSSSQDPGFCEVF